MSILVCCNLPDGVILGADSAVTIVTRGEREGAITQEITKTFTGAEKVFPIAVPGLSGCIAVGSYGLATLGPQTVQSYLREFCLQADGDQWVGCESPVGGLSEALYDFFNTKYSELVRPSLEQVHKLPFDKIPADQKPLLGLVVAGYGGKRTPLAEIWLVAIPANEGERSVRCRRETGNFGTDWFGVTAPITRLLKGFDGELLNNVLDHLATMAGISWSADLDAEVRRIVAQGEYKIPYGHLPLEAGIRHVKSLLDMVVELDAFTPGPQMCGGPTRMVVLTTAGLTWVLSASLSRPGLEEKHGNMVSEG